MVVVLPAPFGPRIAVTWARPAVSERPATAVRPPYRLTRPRMSTAGALLTLASLEFPRGRSGRRPVSVATIAPLTSRIGGYEPGQLCRLLQPARLVHVHHVT